MDTHNILEFHDESNYDMKYLYKISYVKHIGGPHEFRPDSRIFLYEGDPQILVFTLNL